MQTLPGFPPQGRIVHLPHLHVIQVTGDDAIAFLQAQLTQDIHALTESNAALTGYCTANGRLLGSGVVWRMGDASEAACLMVDASIADSLVKRLRMFVLRAKVALDLVPLQVYGVWESEPTGAADAVGSVNDVASLGLSTQVWDRRTTAASTWITAPDSNLQPGLTRWWCITEHLPDVPSQDQTLAEAWQAYDIAAGLPWIQAPTQEMLTPLMANFDLIDGVSFTKGCYPGQEVVARSYYRSKPKRRLAWGTFVAQGESTRVPDLPGLDIYDASSASIPVGRIINAAAAQGVVHVLFEAPLSLIQSENAQLRVLEASGPELQVKALPYALVPESDGGRG